MSSINSSDRNSQQQQQHEQGQGQGLVPDAIIAEHLPSGYGLAFNGINVHGGQGTAGSPGIGESAPNVPGADVVSGAGGSADLTRQHSASSGAEGSQSGEQSQGGQSQFQAQTEESSLLLPGGDIHRGLYKLNARVGSPALMRAKTFSHYAPTDDDDGHMTVAEQMLMPQGFRRQFVQQQLEERGYDGGRGLPFTRNFVEFLDLYGSFAGEDLSDSEGDESGSGDEEDEEQGPGGSTLAGERRPLLGGRKSSHRHHAGKHAADAGAVKTFFTTLKAFIGTGIMFLPKAFNNGGILFSSVTLISVAIITMIAFHLLLRCRDKNGGSYGELGRKVGGPRLRLLILGSITLSQLGFVCTGLVFVADNTLSVLQALTHEDNPLSTKALIAIQAIILIPLAFIRNISKLGPFALLADVFIVIGVGYIWTYCISNLASYGIHPSVQLFNPSAYTLTIGASIFTFEGIGLILPIQESMAKPENFEPILGLVMFIITCIFTGVGALCYATFGSNTQIEVINNFPQESKLVNAVQFMYALAVLVGNPVQLFPAMRILESKIFGHRDSGKRSALTKWKKNGFRSILVILCVIVSIGGSENLDRFVALIGSFACVPLVYIYPPFLHYKSVAVSRWEKIGDVALMTLGAVGMFYTTSVTLVTSFL
ncbi:Vacuolar amino acid transporter 3 [Zalerion maritima]|uniref:Vacuolar amino acid transporter 3 n=1 Tax=Zalerion maritima TaxID=339359 RepID=A0AAD5WNS3_9PEZI|nr:Vacuolar amino acid transporter 3 [Zalerion maritima]